jgi:hypothetical protein
MTTFVTITSASNGTNVPATDKEWQLRAGDSIAITGGSTISATLQKKYVSGWQAVPDTRATIVAPTALVVDVAGVYRIAVTTATGTWIAEVNHLAGPLR